VNHHLNTEVAYFKAQLNVANARVAALRNIAASREVRAEPNVDGNWVYFKDVAINTTQMPPIIGKNLYSAVKAIQEAANR
jgi:hypothetical protein